MAEIDIRDNQSGCLGSTREDLAKAVANERAPPECGGAFLADSIDRAHYYVVGDSVTALNGLPRMLPIPLNGWDVSYSADGGRVKNDLSAGEGEGASGFGKPLIVADEHSDLGEAEVEDFESLVALLKVVALKEGWVVRDVNLAIGATQLSLRVNDHSRVEKLACWSSLMHRTGHDSDLELGSLFAENRANLSGHRLGVIDWATFRNAEVG
jgi:hypothetical protein